MGEKQGHKITSPTQWTNGTFIISCLEIRWSWIVSGLSTISPCFFTYCIFILTFCENYIHFGFIVWLGSRHEHNCQLCILGYVHRCHTIFGLTPWECAFSGSQPNQKWDVVFTWTPGMSLVLSLCSQSNHKQCLTRICNVDPTTPLLQPLALVLSDSPLLRLLTRQKMSETKLNINFSLSV